MDSHTASLCPRHGQQLYRRGERPDWLDMPGPRACLRSGETFPRGAITPLALAKMVVTPLLGVGITRSMAARAGFVDRDDKVLRFVCMCVSRPGC
jgi:hypothetical protein